MELGDYVSILKARKWLLVLSVAVVTLIAVAFSLVQDPTYGARALILVTQQDTGIAILGTAQTPIAIQPERDVQTQVEVIQSRQIAARALDMLGLDTTPEGLLNHVSVSADTETNVIQIQATDASARRRRAESPTRSPRRTLPGRETASVKASEPQLMTSGSASVRRRSKYWLPRQRHRPLAPRVLTGCALRRPGLSMQRSPRSSRSCASPSSWLRAGAACWRLRQLTQSLSHLGRRATLRSVLRSVSWLAWGSCSSPSSSTPGSSRRKKRVRSTARRCSRAFLPRGSGRRSSGRLTLSARPDSPAAEAYRMLRNNLDFVNIGWQHQDGAGHLRGAE